MTELALWRRWRDGAAEAGDAAAEPDSLMLAAYAEGRLGRPGIDAEDDPAIAAVEAWLLDHPEALEDIVAARSAADAAADAVLVARAQALIAAPQGNVVSLRRVRSDWRNTVTWGSVAATMVAAVLIGFSVGNDDLIDFAGQSATSMEQVLLGSPATILSADDEDTGI